MYYIHLFATAALASLMLTMTAVGQEKKSPLDLFLESSETIVVAKCIKASPVDILLRSHTELEVLQVVKGDAKLTKIDGKFRYGMREGERYLVGIPKIGSKKTTFNDDGNLVVPVSKHEDLELLKTLSPRIVVLRTLNTRIYGLEHDLSRITYELEYLNALRKDN